MNFLRFENPIKMDPREMPAAAINKELDALDKKSSKLSTKFIDAGRGYETPSETRKLTDPLAVEWNTMSDRRRLLQNEVERRAGPGMCRLPRGFGPLRY